MVVRTTIGRDRWRVGDSRIAGDERCVGWATVAASGSEHLPGGVGTAEAPHRQIAGRSRRLKRDGSNDFITFTVTLIIWFCGRIREGS